MAKTAASSNALQQTGSSLAGSGPKGATISADFIPAIQQVYYYAAIVHAIGDGILAGVISSGKFSSGMIHAFLMTMAAFVMLRVIAG